jgi:putative salt-induced outer membrane protein YdiY
VETLNSTKPLLITLKNKQEFTGQAGNSENNSMTLKTDGVYQSQPIPLSEVNEINKKFFSGMANVGGGLASGNTNRQSYHGDATITVRGRDDRVILGGLYNYADNEDQVTKKNSLNARNWQLFGNYAHFFTDKWYGYANGLFTNDRLQDIQLRSAFGVGAGYQFYTSDDLNLSLEAGPAYVNVNFYDRSLICTPASQNFDLITQTCPLKDQSGVAGRWALNYDQFVFSKAVQLFHNHEGLIDSGLFIRSRTGFRVPIWNGIQFTNEVQVDYFSKPAPGRQSVDTRYLFSIGYGW